MSKSVRYLFVTGGVVSSLGKGIVASSLGTLLKARGLKVTIQKLDPYINVDAGTMNPYQHGEVFVTVDGAETDLDLGHYERYIDENLHACNNQTTGKIYGRVIERERKGDYLGDTVRVIPHITDQIKEFIHQVAQQSDADVAIVEVGGTVGDIESLPFLEAIRQFKNDVGSDKVMYLHVTLLPHLGAAGELKTKPTQHSVKELRSIGIQPDVLICRTEKAPGQEHIRKIALYGDVPTKAVFACPDVPSIYDVPLFLEQEGLGDFVVQRLGLQCKPPDLDAWKTMLRRMKTATDTVRICLVGKYVEIKDAYMSIAESLQHAGIACGCRVIIERLDAGELTSGGGMEALRSAHGILVPGGFGARGVEGKIRAIEFARQERIPYFGICYGMQWAVVEFARHVCGLKDANSTEVAPDTTQPVVWAMEDQKSVELMGASMRLGEYECVFTPGTAAERVYGQPGARERHRHRYEFNNAYRQQLEEKGLVISGINPERNLVEIIELRDHPWFVACQFHPEFASRPYRAHPLFLGFVEAALKRATAGRTAATV
ncbi:CTP synthase [bacterium]|nr:CTP synthase [bacterium]